MRRRQPAEASGWSLQLEPGCRWSGLTLLGAQWLLPGGPSGDRPTTSGPLPTRASGAGLDMVGGRTTHGGLPLSLVSLLALSVAAGAVLLLELLGFVWNRQGGPRLARMAAFRRGFRPLQLLCALVGIDVALRALDISSTMRSDLLHLCAILIIFAVALLVVSLLYVADDLVIPTSRLATEDNLRARRLYTEIQILRRVSTMLVAVVALSAILLTFPEVRAAGAGLLASAGLIGLLAGVAARPTATNLVAGVQIAISQPIRVDDVVVVEGHWGRVEEITLTMVVVRVWDLRRLVLPIAYFIENPFENWTKATADILGWVFLEVDYTADVSELRARLEQVVGASEDWDRKVVVLQVTNLGPEAMQLRALFSSPDSSRSWNLQCDVRERMVAFLSSEHPDWLPRRRLLADIPGALQAGAGPVGELPSDSLAAPGPPPVSRRRD